MKVIIEKDPKPELDDYCFAGSRVSDEWGLMEYEKDLKKWEELHTSDEKQR